MSIGTVKWFNTRKGYGLFNRQSAEKIFSFMLPNWKKRVSAACMKGKK